MTYAEHEALRARHPISTGMVYGYEIVSRDDPDRITTTLYAVRPSGEAFTTGALTRQHFNHGSNRWMPCRAVPPHAEYVGHYHDETPRAEA